MGNCTPTAMVNDVFASVKNAIGIHVMLLVVERALWQTRNKYEEASMITFSEDGICLDSLSSIDPDRQKLVSYTFVMCIITTLGHLVGKQLAHQLTEQLDQFNQLEG